VDANLTVQDLFKLILFLLGIGAGTYLILVLNKINKILGQAKDIVEMNLNEIDTTIKQLPDISYNINEITRETKSAITNLTPEINDLLHNVNSISGRVSNITESIDDTTNKVSKTVDSVSNSIVDTAYNFQANTKNIMDYVEFIKDLIDIIKDAIYKR